MVTKQPISAILYTRTTELKTHNKSSKAKILDSGLVIR